MRQVSVHFKHALIMVTAFLGRKWWTLAHDWTDTALAVAGLVCQAISTMTRKKRPDGLKIAVEHVSVPDAQERLRCGYERILRAAAQVGERAEEGSPGECLDAEAKPSGCGDAGSSR